MNTKMRGRTTFESAWRFYSITAFHQEAAAWPAMKTRWTLNQNS